MNIELAQSSLWERSPKIDDSPVILTARDEYRRKVREMLTLDSEGKPFRMLAFRGHPRRCKKMLSFEEMMQNERERSRPFKPFRRIPTTPDRILDGPKLMDDYYLNFLDWGKNNILVVALGPSIYLWNAANGKAKLLLRVNDEEDHPTSVAWSGDGKTLAAGFTSSRIEL